MEKQKEKKLASEFTMSEERERRGDRVLQLPVLLRESLILSESEALCRAAGFETGSQRTHMANSLRTDSLG